MPKWKSTLDLARRNPRGVRFDDLIALLRHFGFRQRPRRRGSHIVYVHDDFPETLTVQPWKNGMAASYQVKECLHVFRVHGLIEED